MRPIRRLYFSLWLGTIGLGLLIHWGGAGLRPRAQDVLGDATWAVMMAWLVSAMIPAASPGLRFGAAFAMCLLVETSQLLHTDALDAIRRTTLGHLVMGSDFDPRDIAAYAGGVVVAAFVDRFVVETRR